MLSENNHDSLMVAFVNEEALVRVIGRGSFKVSPALKQFIHKVIQECSIHRVLLDMADCSGMDSTFMGVLAGLSSYLCKNNGPELRLINLSEKNRKLLVTLGVDKVVLFEMTPNPCPKPTLAKKDAIPLDTQTDKLTAAETSLKAHQKLVELQPENQAKFESVVEYLKSDVQKLRG